MSGDLMDERRCRATSKRTGKRCGRYPVPGGTVCYFHGGASAKHLAAAERRRAEAEATALLELVWDPDAPPVTNVIDALHRMAGRLEHTVNVLGARASTEALDSPAALAWRATIREQRQLLRDIARLNIEAKYVELEEQRATIVLTAIRAAVDAVTLSAEVRETLLRAFIRELRVVNAATPGEVVRGELA